MKLKRFLVAFLAMVTVFACCAVFVGCGDEESGGEDGGTGKSVCFKKSDGTYSAELDLGSVEYGESAPDLSSVTVCIMTEGDTPVYSDALASDKYTVKYYSGQKGSGTPIDSISGTLEVGSYYVVYAAKAKGVAAGTVVFAVSKARAKSYTTNLGGSSVNYAAAVPTPLVYDDSYNTPSGVTYKYISAADYEELCPNGEYDASKLSDIKAKSVDYPAEGSKYAIPAGDCYVYGEIAADEHYEAGISVPQKLTVTPFEFNLPNGIASGATAEFQYGDKPGGGVYLENATLEDLDTSDVWLPDDTNMPDKISCNEKNFPGHWEWNDPTSTLNGGSTRDFGIKFVPDDASVIVNGYTFVSVEIKKGKYDRIELLYPVNSVKDYRSEPAIYEPLSAAKNNDDIYHFADGDFKFRIADPGVSLEAFKITRKYAGKTLANNSSDGRDLVEEDITSKITELSATLYELPATNAYGVYIYQFEFVNTKNYCWSDNRSNSYTRNINIFKYREVQTNNAQNGQTFTYTAGIKNDTAGFWIDTNYLNGTATGGTATFKLTVSGVSSGVTSIAGSTAVRYDEYTGISPTIVYRRSGFEFTAEDGVYTYTDDNLNLRGTSSEQNKGVSRIFFTIAFDGELTQDVTIKVELTKN